MLTAGSEWVWEWLSGSSYPHLGQLRVSSMFAEQVLNFTFCVRWGSVLKVLCHHVCSMYYIALYRSQRAGSFFGWVFFAFSQNQVWAEALSRTSNLLGSVKLHFAFIGISQAAQKWRCSPRWEGKVSLFPSLFSRGKKIWKLHLANIQSSRWSAVLSAIWITVMV